MRKFRFRTFGILLSLILIIGALAGCGGSAIAKPTPPSNIDPVSVDGTCSLTRSGNDLIVTGETNILEDALIYVSIHSQDGLELDSRKISNPADGKISETFTISGEFDDSVKIIYAFITCAPKKYGAQDDGVLHLYGDKFEYVDNPMVPVLDENGHNVYVDKNGKVLEADENGSPIVEDENTTMDDLTQLEKSKFQWNSEGVIITFASDPLEI